MVGEPGSRLENIRLSLVHSVLGIRIREDIAVSGGESGRILSELSFTELRCKRSFISFG